MKYTHIRVCLLLIIVVGCNQTSSIETSEKIIEAHDAIDKNLKQLEEIQLIERETKNLDGPYPADEYSLNETGKFYFFTRYIDGKDSTWLIIEAKTENDIKTKYPKLEVYKVRPEWMSRDNWFDIRSQCLEQKMIFDLSDEPKGWLQVNEVKLKSN